jgi:hypothetical protein
MWEPELEEHYRRYVEDQLQREYDLYHLREQHEHQYRTWCQHAGLDPEDVDSMVAYEGPEMWIERQ